MLLVEEIRAVLMDSYCLGITRKSPLAYKCLNVAGKSPASEGLDRYASRFWRYSNLWVSHNARIRVELNTFESIETTFAPLAVNAETLACIASLIGVVSALSVRLKKASTKPKRLP